jgi:hypothetical protein
LFKLGIIRSILGTFYLSIKSTILKRSKSGNNFIVSAGSYSDVSVISVFFTCGICLFWSYAFQSTLLSGKNSVSLPFECRGQVNGLQEGRSTVDVKTFPTGTQTQAFQGGCTQSKRGFSRRCARVWKPKKTKRWMVMGVDVGLEESCNLSLCASGGEIFVPVAV